MSHVSTPISKRISQQVSDSPPRKRDGIERFAFVVKRKSSAVNASLGFVGERTSSSLGQASPNFVQAHYDGFAIDLQPHRF